jgi:hypothetical protein
MQRQLKEQEGQILSEVHLCWCSDSNTSDSLHATAQSTNSYPKNSQTKKIKV